MTASSASETAGARQRATLIKLPDATPGLLIVEGVFSSLVSPLHGLRIRLEVSSPSVRLKAADVATLFTSSVSPGLDAGQSRRVQRYRSARPHPLARRSHAFLRQ